MQQNWCDFFQIGWNIKAHTNMHMCTCAHKQNKQKNTTNNIFLLLLKSLWWTFYEQSKSAGLNYLQAPFYLFVYWKS